MKIPVEGCAESGMDCFLSIVRTTLPVVHHTPCLRKRGGDGEKKEGHSTDSLSFMLVTAETSQLDRFALKDLAQRNAELRQQGKEQK
jgi:hypothetical protein